MSQNNEKHQENDAKNEIDLVWELQKFNNRMLDVLKLIQENAVKIRSNSARISRVQGQLRQVKEEGWEPEGGEEDELFQMESPKIDLHNMDYAQLQEALEKVSRIP